MRKSHWVLLLSLLFIVCEVMDAKKNLRGLNHELIRLGSRIQLLTWTVFPSWNNDNNYNS